MGKYLNPGSARFAEACASSVYVDKTAMVSYLNTLVRTKQKYVCVSRPRRFGKTMATDMLCAYYGRNADAREVMDVFRDSTTGPTWDLAFQEYEASRRLLEASPTTETHDRDPRSTSATTARSSD